MSRLAHRQYRVYLPLFVAALAAAVAFCPVINGALLLATLIGVTCAVDTHLTRKRHTR